MVSTRRLLEVNPECKYETSLTGVVDVIMPRPAEPGTEKVKTLIDSRFHYIRGKLNDVIDPDSCPVTDLYEYDRPG